MINRHFSDTPRNGLALVALAAALTVAASACGGSEQFEGSSSTTAVPVAAVPVADPDVPATISDTGGSESRFFDPVLNSGLIQASWPPSQDPAQFAAVGDVVFIGQFAGFVVDVGTNAEPTEPGQPEPRGSITTFDGLRFRVLEVLSGELETGPGEMATIAHPVLYQTRPEDAPQPIRLPPIEVFRADVMNASEAAPGSRYIIFANEFQFPDGSEGLALMGPGSAARIAPDGRHIIESGSPPFVLLSTPRSGFAVDITVDVLRDWVQGTPPPPSEIPQDAWPSPDDAPSDPPEELVVTDKYRGEQDSAGGD